MLFEPSFLQRLASSDATVQWSKLICEHKYSFITHCLPLNTEPRWRLSQVLVPKPFWHCTSLTCSTLGETLVVLISFSCQNITQAPLSLGISCQFISSFHAENPGQTEAHSWVYDLDRLYKPSHNACYIPVPGKRTPPDLYLPPPSFQKWHFIIPPGAGREALVAGCPITEGILPSPSSLHNGFFMQITHTITLSEKLIHH